MKLKANIPDHIQHVRDRNFIYHRQADDTWQVEKFLSISLAKQDDLSHHQVGGRHSTLRTKESLVKQGLVF